MRNYQLIMEKPHPKPHAIAKLAETLEVSKSGYYDWYYRPARARQQQRQEMAEQFQAAYITGHNIYKPAARSPWNLSNGTNKPIAMP